MSKRNKRIEIKASPKQKKYIMSEIVIAVLMILFLVIARIFNFDDTIVNKVLEVCILLVIIIMNIMVISTYK